MAQNCMVPSPPLAGAEIFVASTMRRPVLNIKARPVGGSLSEHAGVLVIKIPDGWRRPRRYYKPNGVIRENLAVRPGHGKTSSSIVSVNRPERRRGHGRLPAAPGGSKTRSSGLISTVAALLTTMASPL
jgi:hypothetical protein